MFLKLLLSSSLTIIVAEVFLTDDQIIKISQEEINWHSNYILPKHYDIIVTHIQKNILVSNCSIRTEIINTTSSILLYLHAESIGLTLNVFYYPNYYYSPNSSSNESEKEIIYASVKSMYDVEKNIVKYIFAKDLLPGFYIIKLVYGINEETGLKTFYKKDEWFATYVDIEIQHMVPSLPKSLRAKVVYDPNYDIIVEHSEIYTVLSNEPTAEIETIDKKMRKTHFNKLVKPIYLLFLNQINLSLMSSTNKRVKINMWCRMHCEFAHKIAENITLYLFDKWKRLNKTWEINHIALPDFQNKSIISLGHILYREADIIYNDNVDSVATKIKVARFIAHKIIQECSYYENPLWPSSSLLNEAIVAFLGLYVTNQAVPSTRMIDLFVVQIQQESLHFDTEYNTSLYDTSFNISFTYYTYIEAFQTFDHFVEIIMNLSSIQISTDTLSTIRTLNISRSKRKYCDARLMEVVRNYKVSVQELQVSIYSCNYYKLKSFSVKLNAIVIHNIEQIGYYRVKYNIENWQRIARHLNSKYYKEIHVLNRAQIIDDAFHLMITNKLNSTVFWSITKYLSRETDYIAWYPMFKALEYLSNIFLFREPIYFNIKVKMRNLLYDLLYKLKYVEVSNEHDLTKSLRMEAAKWACNLDSRICIDQAKHNLNLYLEDPQNNTLLPWWKEWTYCQGLKILYYSLDYEDSPLSYEYSPWWKVYRLGKIKSKPKPYKYLKSQKKKFKTRFLKYLSCPEDSKFLKDYLNLIKNDSKTSITFLKDFSDKDYINYFLFTIARHSKNPVLLDFILANLENIRPRQISEYTTLTVIINHVYSTNQLQQISISIRDKFMYVRQAELNECKKLWFSVKERNTKVKTSKIEEHFRCMDQYIQYISYIERKIQMRLFEIKSQQNYFQNLVKYQ